MGTRYVQDRRLHYGYKYCGDQIILTPEAPVPPGRTNQAFVFQKTGRLAGRALLNVKDRLSQVLELPHTLLCISMQRLLLGRSGLPSAVSTFGGAFPFTRTIEAVSFALGDDREASPSTLDVD